MIKAIEFLKAVLLPSVIGAIIGFSALLIGIDIATRVLGAILKDNPSGYVIFGSYYFLLGVSGLASFHIDIEKLKAFIKKNSIIKWMAGIAGSVTGLAMASLCSKSGQDAGLLSFFALLFFAITWVVWYFEKLVFAEPRSEKKIAETVSLASAIALVIGAISLCHAWQLICSCGVKP